MIETYLRPTYNRLFVDPIAKVLQQGSIRPNLLTLLAVVSGLIAMILIMIDAKILAIVALLLSGYLDTLDGSLARLLNLQNPKGSVYDIVGDRVVEFAVLYGLCMVNPSARAIPCLWILASFFFCITAFLSIAIFAKNNSVKSFHYNVGLMERAEVFLFFIAMILLPTWFNALAWLLTILVLITSYLHIHRFAVRG